MCKIRTYKEVNRKFSQGFLNIKKLLRSLITNAQFDTASLFGVPYICDYASFLWEYRSYASQCVHVINIVKLMF